MAAIQAESQLNETNREHLQLEKPSEINNSSLQNGTEKNGARISSVGSEVSGGKVKFSTHNYSVDMNQYRQESNIGPPIHNEQNANDEHSGKLNPEKGYLQNIDNGNNDINYNEGLPESVTGPNMPNYNLPFSPRSNFSHPDHGSLNPVQLNSADNSNNSGNNGSNNNSMHQNSVNNQFGNIPNVRHPFPNSKSPSSVRPVQGPLMNTHSSNFHPHGPPQRFMSGQSISQQMGPTPTLNQLLQSSNPVNRYQNNYSEYGNQKPNENPQGAPFNHGWNARPMPPYMNQQSAVGYRNQMPNTSVRCSTVGIPPGAGSSAYSQQPPTGSSVQGPPTSSYPSHPQPPSSPSHQQQSNAPQQYQPYPQRYPTPPSVASGPPQPSAPVRVPAYPAPHHQMSFPYGPMNQGLNMASGGPPYPSDQRLPWPPMQQPQQQPPLQHQQPNSNQPPQSSQHQQQQSSQQSHIPSNSSVAPTTTPTPHSSSSVVQQPSPQSTMSSPQSALSEPSQQSPQHLSQMNYPYGPMNQALNMASGGPPYPADQRIPWPPLQQPQQQPPLSQHQPNSNQPSQTPQSQQQQQQQQQQTQQQSHIPPNNAVPPTPTSTSHSSSSVSQQHSPQSTLSSPQSAPPDPPQQQSSQHMSQGASNRCSSITNNSPYPQQSPSGNSVSGPPTSSYPVHPQPPPSPSHQHQPNTMQQYQPYPQRYPTPPSIAGGPPQQSAPIRVPAYPAPHHQVAFPYGGPMNQGPPNISSSGSPYAGDQRLPWTSLQQPQQQQMSQHHSNSNQSSSQPPQQPQQQMSHQSSIPVASSTPTPHSAVSTSQQHSPQSSPQPVHPEPSPQQALPPQQSPQHPSQSYGNSRQSLTSTTPEPGDLTNQNSNDSSNGGGPQAMRPTPSPTGSTGSRSMSPAIGQQNIPMPPRPSSGQSDSGSTSSQSRLSHSPMAPTQGGYQQPLAPPPHMPNYKMVGSGPQGALHPGGMISNPSAVPSYSPMPPHQPYNQQAYPGRNVQNMPPYHQNYGMQQPESGSHSQYSSRPMPNHLPHSQFPGFQGWPSPNATVGSSSGPLSMSSSSSSSPSNHVASPVPNKAVPPPASSPQHPQQQQNQSLQPPSNTHPQIPTSLASNHHHPIHHMHQQQQQPPQQQQLQPPQQAMNEPQQQSPQIVQNCSPGPRSHTPPQYLKQHLQHKVGYNSANSGMPPSPGPSSGMYGNSSSPSMGPPHHHPMGPPIPGGGHHHLGSNMGYPVPNMIPPHSNSHHESPMPPPSSTPNSHSLPLSSIHSDVHVDGMHESGTISTTTSSGNMTNVSQVNSGGITSVITTGPDGTPIDEASQQSTLSNNSAASTEDPNSTPKRKESGMGMGPMSGYMGHGHGQGPMPPCSPGMNSMHDDYPPESNTPWPRTPSSPVFNSHMPQDIYRSKKHDSLSKLYEMDDSPDRRQWLDKLLRFMEDRGTPISTCPTISKNPLDLFRLYVYVKERGGFVEVTKNKIWKDIAGLLGIGASSSAAYTLRKHYTKNLLPFECHFDRGGIDPQPIINQVESSTKKKNAKAASVPSPVPFPGSSNSQDSFPTGPGVGSSGGSGGMDGYNYGYGNEYSNQRGPPPSMQANQSLSSQPGGYQSQPNYNQYPPADQYGQQYMGGASYPPSRPMYPVYPPEAERGYSQSNSSNTVGPNAGSQPQSAPSSSINAGPAGSDPYARSAYSQPMYHPRPSFSGPGQPQQPSSNASQASSPHVVPSPPRPDSQPSPSPYPPPSPQQQPPQPQTAPPSVQPHLPPQSASQPPSHQQPPPPNQQTPQPPFSQMPGQQQPQPSQQMPSSQSPHDFYRPPDQPFSNQNAIPPGNNSYPVGTWSNKGMPPPPVQQPRRHPDFSKEFQQTPPPPSSYTPYNNQMQRTMFSGWPNDNSNRNQYQRGPYPATQANVPNVPPQQWNQGMMSRPPIPNSQPPAAQWDQHRYPPNSQQQTFPPPQPGQWNMASAGPMVQNSNLRPRANFCNDKPFPPIPQNQMVKSGPPGQMPPQSSFPSAAVKRELIFPPDSVEAVTPLLYKRKRLTKNDVAPVDAWKLMMSLRSGLLTETCWALDVLNILLFDETGVQYFGLTHLPGLLDILLELFNRSLEDMLERSVEKSDRKWYERPYEETTEPDLGRIKESIDAKDRLPIRTNLPDYSLKSRRGSPVATVDGSEDLFIEDGPRSWEGRDVQLEDVVEPDTKYIVPCFRSEFGIVPFARLLPEAKNAKKRKSDTNMDTDSDINHRTKKVGDFIPIKEEPDSDPQQCTTVKIEPSDESSSSNNNNSEIILVKKEKVIEDKKKRDEEFDDEEEEESGDVDDNDSDCTDDSKAQDNSNCKVYDPMGLLKRRKLSQFEDECYTRDEASLYLVTDTQDAVARRCVCLSTILRNLTFIPGNEIEFSKNSSYLALMGKLLLIHHEHPLRTQKPQNYDREDDTDFSDCCSSLQGESEWWWEFLHQLRENVLVSIANIAGYIDLSNYFEEVSRPILDGLLHWAVCPAAQGQDPFPTANTLSPQKLALEALCKLCVTDANVDLVIATPPYSRLEKLTSVLARLLCRSEEQVLREFAVNLLHYLAAAESSMSRIIALQSPCISLLVAFIEQAEQSALGVANQHGITALRDNPESMGTSLDMLRRAARTLLHLSRHPDNKPLFLQQEQRLLALVMSQILDQQVAGIISQVLYQCSRSPSPTKMLTS